MSRIEWSNDYATGIDVIDGQHKRIIEYINQLDDARLNQVENSDDRRVLREVLYNLVDYTLSHFTFEEALMDEVMYPAASIHKRTHEAFRNKILSMQQRFTNGERICEELGQLLGNWLIAHIAEDDNSYVPYVRKKMPGINGDSSSNWLMHKMREVFG